MSLGSNNLQVNTGVWNIALNNQTPKAKAKPRQKKDVVYKNPQFAAAAELIGDGFWREKFYEAGKGKFPTGFMYNNGMLTHKKKKTSVQLYGDHYQLINSYIKFVKENGNIYSPADMEVNRQHTEMVSNYSFTQDTWKDISVCKSKRIIYIRDYVDCKYSHLSLQIRDELYTLINTCYEVGVLLPVDIEYVNNEIVNIVGITANEKGVHILRNIRIPNAKIPSKTSTKPIQWRHYSNCEKIINKMLEAEYVPLFKKQKTGKNSSILSTDSTIDSDDESYAETPVM